ncbi:MAG: family 20 glycosylhydrolase [Thermoflavifilum aggregans]|nr:family 20 glycosylhydrolase [Thermoflavifilum aggregans]
MKHLLLLTTCFMLACISGFGQHALASEQSNPSLREIEIVPAPVSVKQETGSLTFTPQSLIYAPDAEAQHIAALLNQTLKQRYGFSLHLTQSATAATLQLLLKPGSTPHEGYNLQVNNRQIRISAGDGAGLFYGVQTLLQLFPTTKISQWKIPAVEIVDSPRFHYRGMHLDCGRHFFPVSFIKSYLDWMARYKLNTFHWHLTEDQGWRIQIPQYPKLTEVGAYRKQTVIGHNSGIFDGQPYGGYYTDEEIKEIVSYAAARYITVIPEIEMPGHAQAALASYPWLGCRGFGPSYDVWTQWGVSPNVFCAGNDSTFMFLENVLTRVMQLFPSHYIHIGGDECPKDHWKQCPLCQQRMKTLGLKNEEELQSYFIQRIEKFLNAHGRDIIGWDEILEGGLAPRATVMSWRGEQGGIAAAKQHHNVIMTPGEWLYFDHGQGNPTYEPLNIGGYLPLWKVYGYNPVPASLSPDEQHYIIGMQANLWTEYIPNTREAEYMVFPRMLALAEAAWTPLARKNYQDFLSRLPAQLYWLDRAGVHFRIPEPIGLQDSTLQTDSLTIDLKPILPGTKIYYTLDGSNPTPTSPLFEKPFTLYLPAGKSLTLRCIEVTPSGNISVPYSAVYQHAAAQGNSGKMSAPAIQPKPAGDEVAATAP